MSTAKRLTVVLDTNILLISVSSRSKYHWLYQALLNGDYRIAITPEILLEYEELLTVHWNSEVAVNVARSITELPDTLFTSIYYQLNLISSDKDDNKFVDCAFDANADYLVTHDHHFNLLKAVSFPAIPLINIHEFKYILASR